MKSTASQDIRTHEGWLYLAVIIDLFSRLVVGWSMKSNHDRFSFRCVADGF